MVRIKKAVGGPIFSYVRGTWRRFETVEGEISASVTCPKCGLNGTLEDHKISETGEVSPSLECPNPKCDFHDHVQLEDWAINGFEGHQII